MIVRPEEWISKPDLSGNGLLHAWVVSGNIEYPIPIETHNVSNNDIEFDANQDFEIILECAKGPDIYEDEDAFNNSEEHSSMASESVIPAGLFALHGNEEFIPTARIILNGRVVKTYENPILYGFNDGDVLYSVSCLGNEYDAVLNAENASDIVIREGNIVSCVYWVQGWPKED